jgi:hypothetical protein
MLFCWTLQRRNFAVYFSKLIHDIRKTRVRDFLAFYKAVRFLAKVANYLAPLHLDIE